MERERYRKFLFIILFVLGLIVLTYVYNSEPENGPILPCLFNRLTGYKCPGCGMTRAANAIMHRDIRAAYGYNKLLFITPIGLMVYIFFRIFNRETDKLLWLYILIIILYGIIRNI